MCLIAALLNFRSGVVAADELESDFEDDVDFLMAKLKRAQSEKVRRVIEFIIVGIQPPPYN